MSAEGMEWGRSQRVRLGAPSGHLTPQTDTYWVLFLCRGSLLGWSQAMLASVETILITGSTGRQPAPSATASASGITPSPVVVMAGSSSLIVSMPCAHHCPKDAETFVPEERPAQPPSLPSIHSFIRSFIHTEILMKHLWQARPWPDPGDTALTRKTQPLPSGREDRHLTSN